MRITLLLLAAALAWGQQPQPASADPVVLTVGAEKITKSQFDQIMEQVTSQMPPERRATPPSPQARRQLAEQLAEMMAMAQEARSRKLDQNPDTKIQLTVRADQLLATALYQQLAKDMKPDDAALHAYYDEHKGEWEQVTARHILIRMTGSAVPLREGQKDLSDEAALAKATDLRTKIVAGGDFAALAKAESDDTGSGANGGALGEFTRGRMVPQFEQAAFALPVGEVSLPIKTQFGYHVIVVDKHESKNFEEVQPEILQKIQPELAQKVVDDIKKKTTIDFDQGYFGK
jgi:parvulin-like peptidyl-prolyl isomerase